MMIHSTHTYALPAASVRCDYLRRTHRRRLGQLKNTHALQSDLAWQLDELEERLRDLYELRDGPTDILIEREISSLEEQRSALEDRVLHEMIRIDELTAQITRVQQELEQVC